jgi:hypothetical protein
MKVGFNESQKSNNIFDLENFKLDKDYKARIALIEQDIEVEYTHWVDEFGYVVCHGDYQTLLDTGSDGKCRFCKAAENSKAVKPARRRFVTWLVLYRTNKAGVPIGPPVSFEIIPWLFGDDKFNDLVNKKEQWGDLRLRDILVECLGKQYQKFRMDVLPEALWLSNANLKAQVVAEYKNIMHKYGGDMRKLLGRDVTKLEDIDKVINDAVGSSTTVPQYANTDINSILNGAAQGVTPPVNQGQPNIPANTDFSALLGNNTAPVNNVVPNVQNQTPVNNVVPNVQNQTPAINVPNVSNSGPTNVANNNVSSTNFDDLLGNNVPSNNIPSNNQGQNPGVVTNGGAKDLSKVDNNVLSNNAPATNNVPDLLDNIGSNPADNVKADTVDFDSLLNS